jgi:hypothetical protein
VGLGALRRWLADLEDEDAELNPRRFLSDLLSGKLEP